MIIGAMNHPGRELVEEIRWISDLGFEFIDITLEPPRAYSKSISVERVKGELEERGLKAVGHTAYYLPVGSPFEHLRRAAVEEIKLCLEVFSLLGVECVNIHPDGHAPFCGRKFVIERNLQTLRDLVPVARNLGITLMVENLPEGFNTVADLAPILDGAPEVGLHLDIGHANLRSPFNLTFDLVRTFSHRLRHVHLHDNKGGTADLHLPLGAGTMDIPACVRALREHGYDGTITLEVFSEDRTYLALSRDKLRQLWEECAPRAKQPQHTLVTSRP